MKSGYEVIHSAPAERAKDVAIHLCAPAAALAWIALSGRLSLWALPALALLPLTLGAALAGDRALGREHRARAVDLAATVGVYGLGVFAVLSLGAAVEALSILIPVGALLAVLLVLNWALLTAVAANRARYGELFDPPWVLRLPARVRGVTP